MELAQLLSSQDLIVWDGYAQASLCLDLRQDLLSVGGVSAAVGSERRVDASVRGDSIRWLDGSTQVQTKILQELERIKIELNQQCFLGLKTVEAHYAHYPKGGFYQKHVDRVRNSEGRVVTFILYLNSSWKTGDGGELKIYSRWNDENPSLIIEPIAGRLVMFLSDRVIHEVAETKKPRFSLTGWFRRD